MRSSPLLQVVDLVKHFAASDGLFGRGDPVRAVDGVTLSLERGQTLALVGESGSGKTTLGRCILRLTKPTSGAVLFDGIDVLSLDSQEMRAIRRRMQVVFQDPAGSLNPRMTVGAAVREPLEVHRIARGAKAHARVEQLFEEVGLDPTLTARYPHELSGGQKQRVGIARALSIEPEFLVLDEPVSALDVSVQSPSRQSVDRAPSSTQPVVPLHRARSRRRATYRKPNRRHVSRQDHRNGRCGFCVSETATPVHHRPPLRCAGARPDRKSRSRRSPRRDSESPPPGCPFHPRCPHVRKDTRCSTEVPALREVEPNRILACHHAETPMTLP